MASVIYNNKAIIPAPLVTVTKNYRSSGDGQKHGVVYDISLAGTLLPFKGSPSGDYPLGSPSGAFWTNTGYPPDELYAGGDVPFNRLERKQEALRWLFRQDGKILEWYGGAGSPVKCRPKILSINFPEGQWVDRTDYRVDLQAEYLTGIIDEDIFDGSGLQEVSEEWQFNEVQGHDGQVYEITHIVSAKGEMTFDEVTGSTVAAWNNAKGWCDDRVTGSPDSSFVSYATGFTNWVNGGYTKNTNIAENDGSYAVTETWTVKTAGPGVLSTTYIEKSFSVSNNTNEDSIDVTYDGTIYGLRNKKHTGNSAATSAAKSAIPSNSSARSEAISAIGTLAGTYVLSSSPSQKNIAINEKDGIVNFSFNWGGGDDQDYNQTNEATLSYSSTDGIYTLSLSVDIKGLGNTKTQQLTNARNNIPSDSDALVLAQSLVGSQKPSSVSFSGAHISKSTAINENQGTANVSWTWTNRDENNVDIQVETSYPQTIAAEISIPGRIAGPIIQRMNTATAQQITVNYNSEGHDSKPDSSTVADTMDDAGGVPYGPLITPWYPGSYILRNDSETWNPTTGRYSRTRVHTVTEDA